MLSRFDKEKHVTSEPKAVTAKIYPFPAGGRFNANTAADAGQSAREPVVPVAEVAFGNWYHDAAIRDSKRAGER
jgi:hypothetical protein